MQPGAVTATTSHGMNSGATESWAPNSRGHAALCDAFRAPPSSNQGSTISNLEGIVELLVILIVVAIVVSRTGAFGDAWRGRARRALRPALILGGIGFAGGFLGPMVLAPQANQGPLLGIFITGPLGFGIGLIWGILREALRSPSAGETA